MMEFTRLITRPVAAGIALALVSACGGGGGGGDKTDGAADAGIRIQADQAYIPVTGDALAGSDRGTAADAAGPATDATTPSGDATIADTDARSVGDALPPGPDGPRDDARISACATLTSAAAPATRPTDIVWLIDGSPSMRQEIDTVTANLNDFAAAIGAAGIDVRVVMVGPHQMNYPERDAQDFFPICVPPPLSGAPGCPDTDGEHYRHIRCPLHSREALAVGLEHLPEYQDFLRPGASTHVVVVTDDDERGGARTAGEFDQAFSAVAPGYTFHSIVDFVGYVDGCGVFGDECSCGERRGQTYLDLSTQTGGLAHSICDADWSPIFAAISQQIVDAARIPCGYALPDRSTGLVIDPEHVNVDLTTDGGQTALYNVGDAAGCAGDPQGWYYDDPQAPTSIRLCEGACGDRAGEVQITLGCFTRKR